MTGFRKPSRLSLIKTKPKPPNKDAPKTDEAQPADSAADDDLYETGDICAPARDRDDEQRGL